MKKSSDPKVGLLSWDYEPPKGGLGRALQILVHSLSREGISVSTFVAKGESRILFQIRILFALPSFIRRNSLEHVIVPTGPGGLFILRRPRVSRYTVIVYHTYDQQYRLVPGQSWKRIFVPLERRTLRCSDTVWCYSADTQKVLIDRYTLNPEKVVLLPQILDHDAWTPKKPMKKQQGLVVCIARLDSRKGVDVLIEAWKELQNHSDASLVIVGSGHLGIRLHKEIDTEGLSVQIRESLPQSALIALVQRAHVLVCPSYLEGFGLSAAEGLMIRTRIVASDCDGLRSLLHDTQTATLVPPGHSEALADALAQALEQSPTVDTTNLLPSHTEAVAAHRNLL